MRIIPALLLASFATAAMAQTRHDTNAPIDFSADRIELQDRANRAVLSGGVAVKQSDMTLNADRLTVAYTGQVIGGSPQVSRLDAAGGVTVRRPDQTARSRYAVYDLNSRLITMIGGVTLTQGAGNTVNGARLVINLDSGRAVIDGSAAPGAAPGASGTTTGMTTQSGGRVSGTFSVPQRR